MRTSFLLVVTSAVMLFSSTCSSAITTGAGHVPMLIAESPEQDPFIQNGEGSKRFLRVHNSNKAEDEERTVFGKLKKLFNSKPTGSNLQKIKLNEKKWRSKHPIDDTTKKHAAKTAEARRKINAEWKKRAKNKKKNRSQES